MNIWRRKFAFFTLTIGALASPLRAMAQSQKFQPTPQDGEGPFYPKQWEGELDNDLLSFNGGQYTQGTPLTMQGKILSTNGLPLIGATVELWQCDERGEYRHPASGGDAPAARGFQGFSRLTTDAAGGYTFRTIKPVPYNGRPAHLHFKVVAAGHFDLTTQMYFSGANDEGNFLLRLYWFFGGFSKQRDRLTVSPMPVPNAVREELAAQFDMVLDPKRN